MSKEKEITGVLIEPNHIPKTITIENKLEALQQTVGGLIECFDISENTTIICNEEGKINGMKPNRAIRTEGQIIDIIAGNMFVVNSNYEGEFCSLTDEQISEISEKFYYPEIHFMHNDNLHSIKTDWDISHTKPLEIDFMKDGIIMDKCICNSNRECLEILITLYAKFRNIGLYADKNFGEQYSER